jgi:quinol monooxygenase YgiN
VILEVAQIDVKPSTAPAFEAAARKGLPLIAAARGCRGAELHGSIEVTDRYRLLVLWDALADHIEHFQTSAAFSEWRALVSRYFARIPPVEHMRLVAAEPDRTLAAVRSAITVKTAP